MSQIVLDQTAIAKLRMVRERVELADENGHIVGRFEPLQYELEPHWDQAELERDLRERGGRPLAEIIADWKRPQ